MLLAGLRVDVAGNLKVLFMSEHLLKAKKIPLGQRRFNFLTLLLAVLSMAVAVLLPVSARAACVPTSYSLQVARYGSYFTAATVPLLLNFTSLALFLTGQQFAIVRPRSWRP